MLQLRMPWGGAAVEGGAMVWRGDWGSDSSPLWDEYPAVRRTLVPGEEIEEGTMWMTLDDFVAQFNRLCLCVNTRRSPWRCARYRGVWTPGSLSTGAGGKPGHPAFASNPQYSFSLASPADAVVTVSQRDERWEGAYGVEQGGAVAVAGQEGGENGGGGAVDHAAPLPIGFVIMALTGTRRKVAAFKPSRLAGKCRAFSADRAVTGRAALEPGRYAVVPCTFDPLPGGDRAAALPFTLQVCTSTSAKFDFTGDEVPEADAVDLEPSSEDEDEDDESDLEDDEFPLEETPELDVEDEGAEAAVLSRNVGDLAKSMATLVHNIHGLEERLGALE